MSLSRKVLLVLSVSALFMGPVAPVLHLTGFDTAFAKSEKGGGGGKGGGSSKSEGKSGGSKSDTKSGGKSGGTSDEKSGEKSAAKSESKASEKSGKSKGSKSKSGNTETAVASLDSDKQSKGSKGKGAVASELKGLNAAHASANALANASADSRVGRIATYLKAMQTADTLAGDLADDIEAAEAAIAALDTMDKEALTEAYPVFDKAAYDAAVAAASGEPSDLETLQNMTPEEILAMGSVDYAPAEGEEPLSAAEIIDQYGAPEEYTKALADAQTKANGDPDALAELQALTDEEKLEQFRLADSYDQTAYQADYDAAKAALDGLNAQVAGAEQAEQDAYFVATDGRTLSPEAQDAFLALLAGKTLSADQIDAVDEVLAQ